MHSVETTVERSSGVGLTNAILDLKELTSKSQQNPNDPQLTSLTGKKKSSTLMKALQNLALSNHKITICGIQ